MPTTTTEAQNREVYTGIVNNVDGTNVYVVVPAKSRDIKHGPVHGLSGSNVAVGQSVLVLFDENDEPWLSTGVATGAPSVFYVEDYGAKGDGVTDDTLAIQATYDAVIAAGGGVVKMRPVTYLANTMSTARLSNSIIHLWQFASNCYVRFEGVKGKTRVKTTLTGKTYNSTYGPPTVFGSLTKEQNATALSTFEIVFDGVTVEVPANPTIAGIDLARVVRARVIDTVVTSANPETQPTSIHAFGIRMPQGQNYGDIIVDNTQTYGMYAGLIVNTAHTQIRSHVSKWCWVGVGLTGDADENTTDPHASQFQMLKTEWCTFHIAYSSPTVSATSLPSGKPFVLDCGLWDIEDHDTAAWYNTFAHIADNNNQLFGIVQYRRVLSNTGAQAGLIAGGCANLTLVDLSRPGASAVPPGSLNPFAGATAPTGYLLCDGSAKSRTTYAALFAAISTTWGAGDGSTTFNLPDLRGKVAMGTTAFDLLGVSGGERSHTLTVNELPDHGHNVTPTTGAGANNSGTGMPPHSGAAAAGTRWTGSMADLSTGAIISPTGQAHNNLQPYAIINWLIKT